MRQIIWSSKAFLDEEARAKYEAQQKEYLEDEGFKVSDAEWEEVVNASLSDVRSLLNKPVDGIIIAFADLGLWKGRRQGYRILGRKVRDILLTAEENNEWYGDSFNIRGELSHHDGTHRILYRVARDQEDAEYIAEQIFNLEIDEKGFRKRTRSLYPYVAQIFGWKAERFNKPKKKKD